VAPESRCAGDRQHVAVGELGALGTGSESGVDERDLTVVVYEGVDVDEVEAGGPAGPDYFTRACGAAPE
jgi:hypothetical protein